MKKPVVLLLLSAFLLGATGGVAKADDGHSRGRDHGHDMRRHWEHNRGQRFFNPLPAYWHAGPRYYRPIPPRVSYYYPPRGPVVLVPAQPSPQVGFYFYSN